MLSLALRWVDAHRLDCLCPVCTLQQYSRSVPATCLPCADLFSVQGVYPGAQGGLSALVGCLATCRALQLHPGRTASHCNAIVCTTAVRRLCLQASSPRTCRQCRAWRQAGLSMRRLSPASVGVVRLILAAACACLCRLFPLHWIGSRPICSAARHAQPLQPCCCYCWRNLRQPCSSAVAPAGHGSGGEERAGCQQVQGG